MDLCTVDGQQLWAISVKIFVSHVNLHKRVTSAEEVFLSLVDRMTCSVDTSLFAQPVITQ